MIGKGSTGLSEMIKDLKTCRNPDHSIKCTISAHVQKHQGFKSEAVTRLIFRVTAQILLLSTGLNTAPEELSFHKLGVSERLEMVQINLICNR